jgi:hypothetical protein
MRCVLLLLAVALDHHVGVVGHVGVVRGGLKDVKIQVRDGV